MEDTNVLWIAYARNLLPSTLDNVILPQVGSKRLNKEKKKFFLVLKNVLQSLFQRLIQMIYFHLVYGHSSNICINEKRLSLFDKHVT